MALEVSFETWSGTISATTAYSLLELSPSGRLLGSVWFTGKVIRRNGMKSGMSQEWNEAGMVIPIPTFGFTEESIQ